MRAYSVILAKNGVGMKVVAFWGECYLIYPSNEKFEPSNVR